MGSSEIFLNLFGIALDVFDDLCRITTFIDIVNSAYKFILVALMLFANLVKTKIVFDVDFDIMLGDF